MIQNKGRKLMKRIISFLLTICMLCSMSVVFAENDNSSANSNVTVSVDSFTEDNVIYNALKNITEEVSLFSDTSSDEVTTDFDVVMGFDMSYSMYEYDVNAEKLWIDNFKAISEQAPDNTRYAILSSDTDGFTYDLETAITKVQSSNYSGENDVITTLDESVDIFDDDSESRNKIVIVTTHEVVDISALSNKIEELKEQGIIPFIFILNVETSGDLDINGVYQCTTDLELRVTISDLYLAFKEFVGASTIQTYADSSEELPTTDYRPDRHLFNEANSYNGLLMASILNMYKCVPMKAQIESDSENSYDLIDYFTAEQLDNFVDSNNATLGYMSNEFKEVWDTIFSDILNNDEIVKTDLTDIISVISKNNKRRFPVLLKYEDEWTISYSYEDGSIGIKCVNDLNNGDAVVEAISIGNVQAVFDTYEYILNTVYTATNLYDTVDWQNGLVTIDTIYPNTYNIIIDDYANNTVKRARLKNDTNYDKTEESIDPSIVSVANGKTLHTVIKKERNFVIESLTTFDGGFPDIYGFNKAYRIIFYNNINSSLWFYDYLFKATNIGMVSGDSDGNFDPDTEVTYSGFFRMLFDSVYVDYSDIDGGPISVEDKSKYWAYNYLRKAEKLGLLDFDFSGMNWAEIQEYGDTNNVSRGQAAQWICDLLLDNQDAVNAPTLIYDYTNIVNYRSESFEKYEDIPKGHPHYDGVKQLYMNGILNGYGDGTIRPDVNLTRAQICVLIVKCLFHMDENIPAIEANIEGETTAIPIDVDTTKKVIENIVFNGDNTVSCDITISNEHKYLIETTGELTESVLASEIVGDGQIIHKKGSNDDNNPQKEHIRYVIKGEGTYRLTIKREGIDTVNLEITDMERVPMLEFAPKTGGKYVYANNREAISMEDLADANNPNGSQLLFQQSGLKTGTYTLMLEHRNVIKNMDIYLDVQFYDPQKNSEIKITKYGDDLFGTGHSADGKAKSWSCMKGYAEFFGEDVGRVRKQIPDVDGDAISPIISVIPGVSSKIEMDEYSFENGEYIWLSEMYNHNYYSQYEYPILQNEEGMYIMMEIEVESEEGIAISIAAFEAVNPFKNRFSKYVPTNDAPYFDDDSLKGIAQFKPETEAELELFIDDEMILSSEENEFTQPVIITNPFFPRGNKVWTWKTHMNPQHEKWNAGNNVESDIFQLYYFDESRDKQFIFDTRHSSNLENNILPEAELTNDGNSGSNNINDACNLGNYGVKTTYKMTVTNTGEVPHVFCYKIDTVSNMFITVRDEDGQYKQFYVDGQYVQAICSGQATDKGALYPITADESDVKVELPIKNGETPIYVEEKNDKGEITKRVDNPDSETLLKIEIPANSKVVFYIDEVLPTGNPGSIPTQIIYR